ncbi:hypothetical protein MXL19_18855 [Escherichia coli]|nr:hypothetical protein [Escherichia coli]
MVNYRLISLALTAWFEHDLHALTAQQKAACVVLNPEKSHPYIEDMAMFLSPLPVGWRSILGCLKHEKNSVQALCGAGLRGFHGFWTILGKMLKNAFFCALFWTLLIRFWRDFNILCVCLI